MKEGLGAHAMWGFTPALDLLAYPPPAFAAEDRGSSSGSSSSKKSAVLLAQPGDPGHLLKTICCRRRHATLQQLDVYLHDGPPEVLARHLLLLAVIHDWEERTCKYVARLARELVELLRAGKGPMAGLIDFSLLKYREKDELEEVLLSWYSETGCSDVAKLRDQRLRNFFGQQYDARHSVVDWDYTARLKDVAGVIHYKQYRKWRTNGIAFEFGDQVYDRPNLTMLSFAEGLVKSGEHRGRKKGVRGFWLDIRVGPFMPFGVDCDRPNKAAEDLFLVHNKGTGTEQYRHNFAEVAVYNLLSYMWEAETGTMYKMSKPHDIYSGLGEEAPEGERCTVEELLDTVEEEPEAQPQVNMDSKRGGGETQGPVATVRQELQEGAPEGEQSRLAERYRAETFAGVTIHLLSGELGAHLSRQRYRRAFDRVHLSGTAAQYASSAAINEVLAPEATISVDTAKYLVPLRPDQQEAWVTKVKEMAAERSWTEPATSTSAPSSSAANDTLYFHYRASE
ncbi:hypothetical protein JKP88DRAFT_276249 [Tribonema minus]|uniref:Dynein assembly factor 3, axonemal n=1 Tax=Tribonema minus TaxID=303371 RepID=A0A836CI43_9STRA|nr:hypothetical protein JKP88DRAFT_276249 [Tribonema minus]